MYPPQALAFIDKPDARLSDSSDTLSIPPMAAEFFRSVRDGDRDATLRLLRQDSELARSVNGDGRTPLHLATLGRHAEVAQLLLARGADVNARTPTGVTPLHLASQRGYALMVGLLLIHGAEPKAKDIWGNTSRERALENGHRTVARMLNGIPSQQEGSDRGGRRTRSRERNRPARRILSRLRRPRLAIR